MIEYIYRNNQNVYPFQKRSSGDSLSENSIITFIKIKDT